MIPLQAQSTRATNQHRRVVGRVLIEQNPLYVPLVGADSVTRTRPGESERIIVVGGQIDGDVGSGHRPPPPV